MARVVPRPGMAAEIVHLGAVDPVTVAVVDGARVVVVDEAGEEHTFVLNELTAHFTLDGGSYYGPRLRLSAEGCTCGSRGSPPAV